MDKERFLSSGLLEQYILGLTSPDESREVERHFDKFPELREEADAMRKAIENYARSHSIPPPPGLKSKVLSEVNNLEGSSEHLQVNRPRYWLFTLAFTTLLLAVLSLFLYQRSRQTEESYHSLQQQFASFRDSCEQDKEELKKLGGIYAFMNDKATRPVLLQGTSLSPNAEVVVYWNEETQNAYGKSLNLPPPPKGKQYQIWADVDGEMINSGLLPIEGDGLYQIKFIERAASLNITLEPEGGSKHPTVSLLYLNGNV